jgi:RimJ/RimL family protein N-acetyltransferase
MAPSGPVTPPAEPLTDGVVAVRPRRPTDVDAVAAASHDPAGPRWLDDPPMDAAARATSMTRVEDAWRSGRAAPLVIADAVTDEPIGIINLQFREQGEASIAYAVFPAARGRGIAPRAVDLLTAWAFGDLGLNGLLIEADEANTASLRVAEKCGFRRVAERDTGPDERGGDGRTTVVFARREP